MNAFLRLATNKGRRPVIIVAQNDWMAIGARRAGIAHDPSWSRVPVVGCDGLVGTVRPSSPRTLTQLLVQRRRGGGVSREVVLRPSPLPADAAAS
jgi:DNA-binding LacI/PurR family transcriptional regulator